MSARRLVHVIGAVVGATGIAMFSAVIVAMIYREWGDAFGILVAALVTTVLGGLAWRRSTGRGELTTREGFATVGLAWSAMTVFGTLPYLFSGAIPDVSNAMFETAAGFSTTGSSILADPGALGHGILWWRSLTQWIGGMGIIVLSIAILPLLGVGGVQLARAESPGVSPDRLTPRFQETAKRLWLVYVGFTVLEALLLWAGDMTLFEGLNHALTTMATGGFSTNAASIGGYSPYVQWVVIVFMAIAGTSFALHFRALRRPVEYPRHPEFRLYAGILLAGAAVLVAGTWTTGAIGDTIRNGLFTSVSIVTTTGYGTADYGLWSGAMQIIIVGLMFIGGMAGSTGGSVKTYRHAVLVRASVADLRRLIHPRGIFITRFGRESVSDSIVESIQSFFLLYMAIFMTGSVLLALIDAAFGPGLGLPAVVSAVATAIGNVGPGLGEVGPTSNFAALPGLGKWLLSGLMIVGRLEIYPIVLLFTRELWRK